jgi:hypothetical protein
MASESSTELICQHLRQLWSQGPGLTLEDVEEWTAHHGERVSRQAISRALNGRVRRMRDQTALQLARFIESQTNGVIGGEYLLAGRNEPLHATPGPAPNRVEPALQTSSLAEPESIEGQDTWQAVVRTLQESLWRARAAATPDPALLHSLYVRLGDAHLWGGGEYAIARGYFQTAITHATSSRDQALLCTRLGIVGQITANDAEPHLGMALAAAQGDPEVKAWIHGLQALIAHERDYDLPRATRLAKTALSEPGLDQGMRWYVQQMLLCLLGAQSMVSELDHEAARLLTSTARPRDQATYRGTLASSYMRAGHLHTALAHGRAALALHAELGASASELANAHWIIGRACAWMGEVREARRHLTTHQRPNTTTLFLLCKTWMEDRDRGCLGHAQELLEILIRTISAGHACLGVDPPDSPPIRRLWKAFHYFGPVERILDYYGARQQLHRRLSSVAEGLPKLGELVWFASHPGERAPVRDSLPCEDWTWRPGGPDGSFEMVGQRVSIWASPRGGVTRMDLPQMVAKVGKSVRLQARIHGGGDVSTDLVRCRGDARAGTIDGSAHGGGGVMLALGADTVVRLFAHLQEPGDVLWEVRQGGSARTLGRGFMGDDPLHLRLELVDGVCRADVSSDGAAWYSLGEAKVEVDGPTSAGIFGEAAQDLLAITARAETVFDEIRLDAG